jgi:hypothetical protein
LTGLRPESKSQVQSREIQAESPVDEEVLREDYRTIMEEAGYSPEEIETRFKKKDANGYAPFDYFRGLVDRLP